MAGTSGMGSPNQLNKPVSPELNIAPPEGMSFQAPSDSYVEAPRPSLDEIFSQQSAPIASTGVKPSLDEIFGNAQTAPLAQADQFTTEQPDIMQRLGEIPARAKASFQVTDKEIKTSLEQSFGKDNVRTQDGSIEYKGKDNKWREWDAGLTAEDFTVDLLRPIVEEVPASLATLAASVPAVASMIASGGIAMPASVAGVALARSGGALAGQAVADFMQSLTGVPRDKDRSAVLEYGATAVLAPIAGLMADYATKKIAQSAAKSQIKKLIPANELYKEEITGIKEALGMAKELGGMENIPGTDTPLMLSQLNPSNPIARELTEKASSLNGFKQAQEQIVQGFDDSSKAFIGSLGNIESKTMKTGQEFKSYVQEAIKKEGEAIGAIRNGLIDAAGNGELPVPALRSKVEAFAKDLGFNLDGETNIAALKNYLIDEQGYSKQAAEVIVNKTNRMLEKVTNKEGRLTAKELVGNYEEMNGVYRNIVQGGGEVSPLFKRKIGEMRRFFADELADKVDVIAGAESKASYLKDLKNYRELVTSADEFSNLLDKNTLASHSLSKAIFNKGAGGLDSAEAAKVLLRDRPDLLNDVKGSFLQDSLADSFNEATKKTDWVKFNKKMLNPELQPTIKAMFGENAIEGFKAYQTIGKAIEAGNVGTSNSPSRALLLKNMALAGKSVLTAGNAGLELIKQSDADGAFAEIITKEGIDNFLKTAPKDSKPILKKILSVFQQAALRTTQALEIPLRRTGKGMSKEAADEKNK